MKCGIHVYVCHDALSMQCLYALLDLSWCGTAQNTERRTLVSHTVYTCKLLSFDLFLFFDCRRYNHAESIDCLQFSQCW